MSAGTSSPREATIRSEEHTSELQSPCNLVCRLLLEKKKKKKKEIKHKHKTRQRGHSRAEGAVQLTTVRSSAFTCVPVHFVSVFFFFFFFFFNDTATTEIYTLSLHDALPICPAAGRQGMDVRSCLRGPV